MTASTDIEALYQRLLSSWNDRDAARFGGLFADDGSLVGFDGSQVESRASITQHLQAIFTDHRPATYVAKVREVRQLSSDAAILRGVAGMIPPGATDLDPEVNAVHVVVAVERGAGWQVAHFQTTPAAFHGRPEAVEALTNELRALLER